MDHQVAVWVANDLPSDTAASTVWAQARLSLLSSGAAVARRCYGGDLAQCRLALRLKEPSDPVVDLYDDTDRRRLVGHVEDDWRGRSLSSGAGVCIAGNDETCIALLRGLEIPDPVSSAHRVQLVQVAMSMGGADAMQRLLLTSGTLDERLAAAARTPTDSVVRVWLHHVRSGSKSSEDMSPLIAGFSLGWTVLFGAMALRSSRWR